MVTYGRRHCAVDKTMNWNVNRTIVMMVDVAAVYTKYHHHAVTVVGMEGL